MATLPGLVVAGLIFGANMYYDLDTQTIMMQQATTIVTPAGKAISLTGKENSDFTVSTSGKTLTLAAAGGTTNQVIINSAGTGTDAIDINATAGGLDVDTSGALALDSATSISIGVLADKPLTIESSTFDLDASGALTLDSATSISIGTLADKPVDIDATTLTMDASDNANLTVTGAGKTLTLAAAGGTTNRVIIDSAGTGTNAISLNASAGGLDVDASGALALDSATSISIGTTTDKPIDIDATTFDLDASGAITIDTSSGNAITINATGAALNLKTTTSGDIVLDPGGTGTIVLSANVAGDDVMQGLVPIFGFDLPAQTNSATYITVSRVLESDPFPTVATNMTRKYKFVIRYADELAAGASSWSVCPAATADASCTESFTVSYSTRTLGDGSTTAAGAQVGVTNLAVASSANFDVDNWIFVDNAGTDYWSRITVIPDGTHITVLTAVSADNLAPVAEYTTSLDKGDVEITVLQTPVTYPWRLAVKMDGTNHIRIYQIFLAAYDIE